MAKIQILVGSVGGTASQVAAVIAHVLNAQGHNVRVNQEPTARALQEDKEDVFLVCCSTTGQGELPHNIYPLFMALDAQNINLQGRFYGVIALGDSGYQYFAQAGYLLENAFHLSGAKRLGDVFTIDARKVNNHALTAAQWSMEWIDNVPV